MKSATCPDCGGPMYRYARFCTACKAKGERNAMYGRQQTEATRARIAAKAAGRSLPERRGEGHPMWKGELASKDQGRERARTLYPSQPCQMCGVAKSERHHVDGNTLNNEPENILLLCRPHHRQIHPGNGKRPLRPPNYADMARERIVGEAPMFVDLTS